jgi:hypothetical protein
MTITATSSPPALKAGKAGLMLAVLAAPAAANVVVVDTGRGATMVVVDGCRVVVVDDEVVEVGWNGRVVVVSGRVVVVDGCAVVVVAPSVVVLDRDVVVVTRTSVVVVGALVVVEVLGAGPGMPPL